MYVCMYIDRIIYLIFNKKKKKKKKKNRRERERERRNKIGGKLEMRWRVNEFTEKKNAGKGFGQMASFQLDGCAVFVPRAFFRIERVGVGAS